MKTENAFIIFTITCVSWLGCDTKTKSVDSCGDGFLDPGEMCDRNQFVVENCEQLGFYSQTGPLSCETDCTVDTSVCMSRCGDGIIQTNFGEDCDGENLAGQDCESLERGSGVVACNSSCRWDFSGCENSATCGDGVIDTSFEDCEGPDLQGATCELLGYYG